MHYLLAWIGVTDLRAPGPNADGLGPIAQALRAMPFDRAVFLDDFWDARSAAWCSWLSEQSKTPFEILPVHLSSPTAMGEIYQAAVAAVAKVQKDVKGELRLTFHLSPGTPAMAAVWLLLAKARYGATLIESSRDRGVRTVDVPFDIAADFLPDLIRSADERATRRAQANVSGPARFGDIVYRSDAMQRLIDKARRAAVRSVPVLLLGESGTGKELMARAIHDGSLRRDRPFVAVNCGAIPADLMESELFGHERGAFTGANQQHAGLFEQADGGTLFLDEIGEFPLAAQVKLLRTLQEGEFRRIGATKGCKVDVRVIAATHRDLMRDVVDARFREDLFYRLAVAVLRLPPLRERAGDLPILIEHLWSVVEAELRHDGARSHKSLSVGARNLLMASPWPGNVRELLNTLRRIALWTDGDLVTEVDVADSMLVTPQKQMNLSPFAPSELPVKLPELLAETASAYLEGALRQSGGNKTKAAKLVGLASYQTLTNWMERYGVKDNSQV